MRIIPGSPFRYRDPSLNKFASVQEMQNDRNGYQFLAKAPSQSEQNIQILMKKYNSMIKSEELKK